MKRKVQTKGLVLENQHDNEKVIDPKDISTENVTEHATICNTEHPTSNNPNHINLDESLSISTFDNQVNHSCFSFIVSPTNSEVNLINDGIPQHFTSGEPRHVAIPFYSLQEREVLIDNVLQLRVVLESSDCSSAYDIDLGVPIQVYRASPRNIVTTSSSSSQNISSCSSSSNSIRGIHGNFQDVSMDYIYEWVSGKIYLIRRSHIIFSYTPDKTIKVQKQHSITINNQLYYIYDPEETSENVFAITTLFHSVKLLKKRKVLYINKTTPHELILELIEDILEIELMNPPLSSINNNSNNNNKYHTNVTCAVERRKCYLQLEKDYHIKLIRYGDKLFTNLMYGQVRSSYPLKKIVSSKDIGAAADILISQGICNEINDVEENRIIYYLDSSIQSQRIALKIFRYNHRESAIRINNLHDYLYNHKRILTTELTMLLPSIQNRNENIIKEIEFMNYLTKQSCNSEIIVPLKDIGISVEHIYTVTNYYPIGSLKKYLESCCNSNDIRLDERVVRVIMSDILHSLVYLHSYGIAHQDISIENILLHKNSISPLSSSSSSSLPNSNNNSNTSESSIIGLNHSSLMCGYRFLLIDMGHARAHEYDPFLDISQRIPNYKPPQHDYQQQQQIQYKKKKGTFKLLKNSTGQQLGKLYYHCPDLPLAPQQHDGYYYCGFAVDCWQVGILMLILLTGQSPFEVSHYDYSYSRSNHYNRQQWFELIRKNQLSSKVILCKETNKLIALKELLSISCLDLLEKLLTYDPIQRITIEQALNHRWLQNK